MSSLKLNAEQTQFVNNQQGNMLVSASAGSGKTTTMIYKLVNLIVNNNVPVQNLLVVTFTEAAAQEMKQKLYFELVNEIKNNNFSDEKLQRLYNELDNIMVADIGTVHSVCKKIVTKYFYAVSVEPNFKIIADVEYESLFNTALNNVFNNYVESADAEFYKVFEAFNEKRNFKKLKGLITSFYNFLSEQTNADGWFYKTLDEITNTNINENKCAKYLFNYYYSNLISYKKDFNSLLIQATQAGEKQVEVVNSYLNFINEIENKKSFTELNKIINSSPKFKTMVPVKNPQFYDYYETLKLTVKTFKECLEKAKENFVSVDENRLINDCENLKNLYLKIYEITNNVTKEFSKIKQNLGALDFSDLQKLTLKILEDEKIKLELQQNYKYIFVDEYQDINQIQEDIILNLTSGNNLYMIGDIKQSIYAFRQCKPEIFLNKYNMFGRDGVNNKLLKLNDNYRSAKNIIEFANMVFSGIITTNTIGINYVTDAKLKCCFNEIGNVKLNIVNTQKDEEAELDYDKNIEEAEAVLTEINNVIGEPYFNQKLNCVKNLSYNDIAILTRDSKGFVIELYKLLAEHNIPVSISFKQSIFNTTEVNVLYSFLKLIANHTSEVDLATVLHSEMFNVSNNELAQIKLEGIYDNFYENVINYHNFGTNSALSDKIKALFNELEVCRHKLNYYSVYETMEYVINKFDLKTYYYALPDGNEKLTNLEVFCELLKNEMYNFNLNGLIEFLESLTQKDDFVISSVASENSIKIITMHKSKGLEYPCVILCNMGKSFNNSVYYSDIVISEELGIGVNYKDTVNRIEYNTIQKRANVLNKISSELNEQIRLLYVAITRAKNFLTIVGSYDLSKFEFNYNRGIKSATNFLDLIFKSFNKVMVKQFLSGNENFNLTLNGNNVCEVEITTPSAIKSNFEIENIKIKTDNFDEKIVNQIVNNVSKNLNYNTKLIATKNSVSALMEQQDYVNNSETDFTLKFNDEGLNDETLKLGTAYHVVMQNINYSEPLNFDELILSLVSSGKIENSIANKINKIQIEKAYLNVKQLINENTIVLKEQQFLLNTTYSKIVGGVDETKVLIQGVVDLILINGNTATIIDFKTNKTKNVSALIEKYKLQLNCYALAVSEGKNLKVTNKMLYLFNLNKFVELI